MSNREVCDTRCAAFRTAMIQKEENTRIRWFLKNQQKLLDHLGKTKDAKLSHIRESEEQPSVGIVHNHVYNRSTLIIVQQMLREDFLFYRYI